MSTSSKLLAVAAWSLLGLAVGLPARADILDDIKELARAARDQAEAAKDRAIEARNSSNEIRDNMLDSVANITAEMRGMITDAAADLQRQIQDELDGRDAFVNGPECALFRARLIGIVDRLEAVANAVFVIAGAEEVQLDFQRERDLIQALPCRALFPLYRAGVFGDDTLLEKLDDVGNNLVVVAAVLEDDEACTYTRGHVAEVRTAIENLERNTKYLKLTAKLFGALGKVPIQPEAAAWGWVGFVLKSDASEKVGSILEAIADTLSQASEDAREKLKECVFVSAIDELRANQELILANQERIMILVSGHLRR